MTDVDDPQPADDPGHLLPQADWDRVVAEAERLQKEEGDGAG